MDGLLSCISLPVIYASAHDTITNHQVSRSGASMDPDRDSRTHMPSGYVRLPASSFDDKTLRASTRKAQSILWLNYRFSGSAYFVPHMKLCG